MTVPGHATRDLNISDSDDAVWSRSERWTAEIVVLILSWALAGLAMALVGAFHWWTVLPLSVGTWAWVRRLLPKSEPGLDGWWIATLAVALASTFFNSAFPAEHVFTGRDNGTYLATAGWLAESGHLTVDAGHGPLGEHEDLHYIVPGFYDVGLDRILEPQFMHAYPAMLGTLIDLGGLDAAFIVNPLLGATSILALFCLARRLMRPAFAFIAAIGFATGLVFVYFSRATFSELLMTLCVVAGIWWLGTVAERRDDRFALLAGGALGAATVARLDGLVLLPLLTAYMLVRGSVVPESARAMHRARVGMFTMALIGVGESLLVSPPYVLGLRGQVVPVLIALLVVLVAHRLLENRIGSIVGWVQANRKTLFRLSVALLLLAASYGWFVRPFVTEATSNPYALESIQEREGLEIGSNRNYTERSIWWITWYQGWVFVALAVAGCVALTYEISSGSARGDWSWLLPLLLIPFAMLYLWKPSINPDHIWVMRRYLTVVIPLGAVAAALGGDRLAMAAGRRTGESGGSIEAVVGSIFGLALLIPPMMTTIEVWDLSEFAGLSSDFMALCDEVGPDANVLFLDDESGTLGDRFAQSFRSYCGLTAAWGGAGLTASDIGDLADQVSASGGRLVLVADDDAWNDVLTAPYSALQRTLTVPPRELVTVDLSMSWVGATGGS